MAFFTIAIASSLLANSAAMLGPQLSAMIKDVAAAKVAERMAMAIS
jgi:hypothetical protein